MSSSSDVVRDCRAREFRPVPAHSRVASLVPSITELLFDLGLAEREIAARTTFCVRPPGRVDAVPRVGGTRTVHVDELLALGPDLVIANRDENTRDIVDALECEVPVFVTDPRTVDDALRMIGDLGYLLRRGEQARRLLDGIMQLRDTPARPQRRVLYLIWRDPYMSVSPQTFIHSMLLEAGCRHCIDEAFLDRRRWPTEGARRYPELRIEDIRDLAPDDIFFSSEPYPFKATHADELRTALLDAGAPSGSLPRMHRVDGELYSWYGSRMAVAFRRFHDGAVTEELL